MQKKQETEQKRNTLLNLNGRRKGEFVESVYERIRVRIQTTYYKQYLSIISRYKIRFIPA